MYCLFIIFGLYCFTSVCHLIDILLFIILIVTLHVLYSSFTIYLFIYLYTIYFVFCVTDKSSLGRQALGPQCLSTLLLTLAGLKCLLSLFSSLLSYHPNASYTSLPHTLSIPLPTSPSFPQLPTPPLFNNLRLYCFSYSPLSLYLFSRWPK